MRRLLSFALALSVVGLSVSTASAEKRVALVIGNSNYRNVPTLDNPQNDARLIARTLSSLGFTIVGGRPYLNLDRGGLEAAVQKFGSELQGAQVGLFYYSGHGRAGVGPRS